MNISAEEKNRYLREAEVVLAREGFLTDRIRTGGLRVLLDGLPLCEVPESGGVTYRMADISTPERITAKDKVYSIVRAVTEYMYQMERAPILKVDGLEDSYKVLAEFNGVVLAGCQSKYGTQFVTWDRDFDHRGVSHGHYYTGLYASGNYEAAKRDFATRSGLIPEQQVFREEQLMQYSFIGSSEYESQRLRHLFIAAAPMAEINAELLKSTVSQVYVKKGQASLLLKNGQIIERSQ